MTDQALWHEHNARELAGALSDVRQRLEQFIRRGSARSSTSAVPERPVTAPSKTVSRSIVERLLGKPSTAAARAELPQSASRSGYEIPPAPGLLSALEILVRNLGLSSFEKNVLVLCAAMELDTRVASLCSQAQDDPVKPYPTFALARTLFDEPSWDALSPERPLRFWRLLEINQPGAQPLTTSALRADERIVSFLNGLTYLDDRLSPFLSPLPLDPRLVKLSTTQVEVTRRVLHRLQFSSRIGELPVVQLLGSDPISKQFVALAVNAELERQLYRLPAELIPTLPGELETLSRLWQRESRLLPLALYIDAEEVERSSPERLFQLNRFLARADGVIFLGTREIIPRLSRSTFAEDVAKPSAAEQEEGWNDALGRDAGQTASLLAAQFNLNLSSIIDLSHIAQATVTNTNEPLSKKVWDICCRSERPQLDVLAQRLETKMTWDDLVLPKMEMELLHQLASQVRQRNTVYQEWGFARKMNRGFSISALFAGESGTGKTMAAEVIANELRLNLYRIDLSGVVNKYIGETEKNLRRLFDAAEDGGAILFFDEADALFGKRSEVKDSHDRYANIEVNYLLQRMESYRGLAILATNMKSALDAAFIRRLRFVVNFPFPTSIDRRRLWEKVFLQTAAEKKLPHPPIDMLDYDRLARLNLAGGHIHNVALNAAFLAAGMGVNVSMPLILSAARAECVKLNRPINESDFKWTELAPVSRENSKKVEDVLA